MNNERLLGSVPTGHDYLNAVWPTICQPVKIGGRLMRGARRMPSAGHSDHDRLLPTRRNTGEYIGLVGSLREQSSANEAPNRT